MRTVQEQIETLIEDATQLTFERAFGWESQHRIEVWMNLQHQIEYKMQCAKALRSGEPIPVEPVFVVEKSIIEPAARRQSEIEVDIPEEPRRQKVSNLQKEVISGMNTSFEL